MAVTPVFGWEIPDLPDAPNVPFWIAELADDIEGTIDGLLPILGGLKFASGKVAHNTVNGWNAVGINFPAGLFTTTPVVQLSRTIDSTMGYAAVGLGNVGPTGVNINVYHTGAVGITIHWLAVGL